MVNAALLQLVGVPPPAQPQHPPSIRALSEEDRRFYDLSTQCIEELALYLKYNGNGDYFESHLYIRKNIIFNFFQFYRKVDLALVDFRVLCKEN